MRASPVDSVIVSRVKVMDGLTILAGTQIFRSEKFHAADTEITDIFSFKILHGSIDEFKTNNHSAIVSASIALKYFATVDAAGKELKITTSGDTLIFNIVAVYKDFPHNSHEQFNSFIRFDSLSIHSLNFNPEDTGIYGEAYHQDSPYLQSVKNRITKSENLIYFFQPISEIYFGPRVLGEDSIHGDRYSIIILISITALILFLALVSFVNLTTLSLPHRSKEIAIKKLAGTSQSELITGFTAESFLIVAISSILGLILLLLTSHSIEQILSIDIISLLMEADPLLILIWSALFLFFGIPPVIMTLKFIHTSPNRLLSSETLSFPGLRRVITFLQLGISIFLIVSSLVIRRQINYSLLKEPGRNHDQVVYLAYPPDLTDAGLRSLRVSWKTYHPNVLDLMATSQLPDKINSKELNSPFYFMSVDPAFNEFFNLHIIHGNWFKANAGDSITVVNEKAASLLGTNKNKVLGVFKDMSGLFNQPEKPVKINIAPYFNYNFLCIRVLEVDIRRTVGFLSNYFKHGQTKAQISYLNKNFGKWLTYQDSLNALSEILAIISGILSCCAIYGLSISIVRDKIKQIALHKLFGASTLNITRLLVREFTRQMLIAILVFGPLTYIILKELLRNFVYSTHLSWVDPLYPLVYCGIVIFLLCSFQALSLNRADLSTALR